MVKIDLKTNLIKNSKRAFSLIEVMIAMAIFAVFVVSFLTGQSYNVLQSSKIHSNLKLYELAKMKMNETLINLPTLKESLGHDIKKFKKYPEFTYEISIKKIFLPSFAQQQSPNQDNATANQNAIILKNIYSQIKKNLKHLVWQIEVIVKDQNQDSYRLATWTYNATNDQVLLQGF